MSEYWKSTPKYWCKHCSIYVRDTKLEKANHEGTPKHQGNLKRFLRDLHRGHEKDEKDKERAKAEVARLNGVTTAGEAGPSCIATASGIGRGPAPSVPKVREQATPSQRKQQLAQLAEMGISIPDGFRPDLAMAGEWQVTSERILEPTGEKNPEALALGVRKRAVGEEEEGEGEFESKKRRWGSTYKTHPIQAEDDDLDALLNNVTRKDRELVVKAEGEDTKEDIKTEPGTSGMPGGGPAEVPTNVAKPGIKSEPSEGETSFPAASPPPHDGVKQEGEERNAPEVVFKKRRAKNIRQK